MNQSVSQSVSQSINQSNNQSVSQSMNQSVSQCHMAVMQGLENDVSDLTANKRTRWL